MAESVATGGPQPIERPEQIAQLTPDQLVAVIVRLTMEISVLRDRLATHEQLLEAHGLLSPQGVDQYQPAEEERQRRARERTGLIDSVLKDLS